MGKRIIGKDISPKCAYCKNGKPTPDGKSVFCIYCGIPDSEYCCKKYKYDPLKREPQKPAALAEFTADDFKL